MILREHHWNAPALCCRVSQCHRRCHVCSVLSFFFLLCSPLYKYPFCGNALVLADSAFLCTRTPFRLVPFLSFFKLPGACASVSFWRAVGRSICFSSSVCMNVCLYMDQWVNGYDNSNNVQLAEPEPHWSERNFVFNGKQQTTLISTETIRKCGRYQQSSKRTLSMADGTAACL